MKHAFENVGAFFAVIPAQAGTQRLAFDLDIGRRKQKLKSLGPGLRRDDGKSNSNDKNNGEHKAGCFA